MKPILSNRALKISGILIGLLVLIIIFGFSMSLGQIKTPFRSIIEAFTNYNPSSTEHIIITTTRISRSSIAVFIGASLAISGALMQALTRNPLASPSIFGINAGALFFVVFATSFLSVNSLLQLTCIALLGGAISAIMVFSLGSLGKDSLSPIKIILSGAAITAFFSSFTQGMLVIDEQSLQGVLFWFGGSVSERSIDMLLLILPFITLALVAALFLSSSINILNCGEDIAKGLGLNVLLIKMLIGIIIVLLAGSSVALCGSIGFIGLIVPHLVRSIIGIDYRWIIPYCGILGAILLLLADIIARLVIMPQEMPIGVVTSLIGVPFFIYIAKKGV